MVDSLTKNTPINRPAIEGGFGQFADEKSIQKFACRTSPKSSFKTPNSPAHPAILDRISPIQLLCLRRGATNLFYRTLILPVSLLSKLGVNQDLVYFRIS